MGVPERWLFGLRSDIFLSRTVGSMKNLSGLTLVARADVVATEPVLRWLAERPGTTIVDERGTPLIGFVSDHDVLADEIPIGICDPNRTELANGAETVFVRKLRRRETIEALDLRATSAVKVDRKLFDLVYKGVTDIVTAKVWPEPAFHLVRLLSRLHVPPNAVTLVGMVLVVVAAWRFAGAHWATGLAAAWLMTFLDTVDGKLARVTGTSTKLGDILDHGTDLVHPPAWWACVAHGIEQSTDSGLAWPSFGVILLAYLAGRVSEIGFKAHFGFNQYLWKPFDSRLRTIIARRNIILLFLTASALLGEIAIGWIAAALWSVVSIGLQVTRTLQALREERQGRPIANWMG